MSSSTIHQILGNIYATREALANESTRLQECASSLKDHEAHEATALQVLLDRITAVEERLQQVEATLTTLTARQSAPEARSRVWSYFR